MTIKITSVDESIENNGLKVSVHGPAGAGKTVLCATAKAPTLILNTEGGLLSIRGAPDYIKTARITNMADLYEMYNVLKAAGDADKREYDWIMLDSCSEIAEVILANAKKRAPDPRQAYGELIDQMLSLLKDFRDLPHYNVCMTFKQGYWKDSTSGIVRYGPSLPGQKLDNEIPYLTDEVFALRVELDEKTNKPYRVLQTSRDIQYEAKDRSGKLDMFEIPKLAHIHDKIYG